MAGLLRRRREAAPRTLEVEGRAVPLRLTVNARARRVSLRVDTATEEVVVTRPPGVSAADAMAFAREKAGWVGRRLAALPERVAFTDGAAITVLGEALTIRHRPDARAGVWREGQLLCVSGHAEHVPRRVRDWLKAEARRALAAEARPLAACLGRKVGRVSVRDTRSRWGSCSADGNLSFSWRLVLAPPPVMTYVVAHEVAHLAVMNHSPAFWAVVRDLVENVEAPRAWLRANGPALHRMG